MTSRSMMPVFELLTAFVVVFLVQQVTRFANITAFLFVLQPPVDTNPWTVVTSVFAHGGWGHLLSNSVALLVIGIPIAIYTTRLRFHLFFISAGALAGISQIVLSNTGGVLGASGGVFALLGYLIASNRISSTLRSLVSVPRWVAYTFFFVLAVIVTAITASPGVALIAHFTGFLFGLFTGRLNVLAPRDSRD
jgi:membrane associated rhomboid family serine protease